MESLYYVMSWACHRKCKHCYETRFRPYVRDELKAVVAQSVTNFPRIIANMPDSMMYRDLSAPLPQGGYAHKTGRIILAGGEALLEPVLTEVTYPVINALNTRYGRDGVNIVVQTTGDLVTEKILDELLFRGVWMISISGMDDFHVGMEGDAKLALMAKLKSWFDARQMHASGWQGARAWGDEDGPLYHFFGANPDEWIGKLWPRGRAWENGLSTATIQDNFCAQWSGARNFLNHGYAGSEVSIDPNGDVFPCCMKTRIPIGNLTEEPLIGILDSLAGHPVYEALSAGRPDRMGIAQGWDMARMLAESETLTPAGKPYRNLCIGCDRFHDEVMAPIITALRNTRSARQSGTIVI